MELFVDLNKLNWSSDWNGYEVGFPDVPVVGCYTYETEIGIELSLHINTETGEVLEVWTDFECE
ncbi:MAG: hypothetical protein ACI35R_10905 [Bacillus sp. (in: firmicutes)]